MCTLVHKSTGPEMFMREIWPTRALRNTCIFTIHMPAYGNHFYPLHFFEEVYLTRPSGSCWKVQVWRLKCGRRFQKALFNAISLSVAPVSATMAGAAPVCGGVWTVPRCALCSSSTERLCTDGYKRRGFYLIKGCTAVAVNLKFQRWFDLCENFTLQFILFYAIYCIEEWEAELWKVTSRETKVVQNEHQSQSKIWFYS